MRLGLVWFCLWAVVLPALPSGAESGWPAAYARRDYRLGISIAEFREIKHPDQAEWPNAFPICSGEEPPKESHDLKHEVDIARHVSPPGDWADAGAIKCRHFWIYGTESGRPRSLMPAGLALGHLNSGSDFFFFPPCEGCMPVLFLIETGGGRSSNFDYIARLFREAYGPPHSTREVAAQDQTGNTYLKKITQYKNSVSTITLEEFGEARRMSRIRYILTPVWDRFERSLTAAATGGANTP